MQRRLAKILLLLISFGLIAPALPGNSSANGEAKLPSCCRKDGKHKCGMKSMSANGSPAVADGPTDIESTLRPGTSKCPYCPEGKFSPARDAYASTVSFSTSQEFQLATVGRVVQHADPISSTVRDSHSQRGPPVPIVRLVSTSH